jgi:hypothetical protein
MLMLLGLSIEFWYVTVPVLVALVACAIVVGAKRDRRQQTRTRTAVRATESTQRQALLRRADAMSADLAWRSRETRHRSRCDWCGAPRRHGTDSCRYCGRSLLLG